MAVPANELSFDAGIIRNCRCGAGSLVGGGDGNGDVWGNSEISRNLTVVS